MSISAAKITAAILITLTVGPSIGLAGEGGGDGVREARIKRRETRRVQKSVAKKWKVTRKALIEVTRHHRTQKLLARVGVKGQAFDLYVGNSLDPIKSAAERNGPRPLELGRVEDPMALTAGGTLRILLHQDGLYLEKTSLFGGSPTIRMKKLNLESKIVPYELAGLTAKEIKVNHKQWLAVTNRYAQATR